MRITAQNPIVIKQQLADLLGNLEVGDTVKGRIIEAFAKSISIKTASGQIFTAALMKETDLNPGQTVELNISSITEDRIFAELKSGEQEAGVSEDNKLQLLLKQMNIEPEGRNLQTVKLLLKNNMPVTKENIIQFANTQKSIESLAQGDAAKAVALLQSELNINGTEFTKLVKIAAALEPQSQELLKVLQTGTEAAGAAAKQAEPIHAEQQQTEQTPGEFANREFVQTEQTDGKQAQLRLPDDAAKQNEPLKQAVPPEQDSLQKPAALEDSKQIMQQLTALIDTVDLKQELPNLDKLIATITKAFEAASKAKPEQTAYMLSQNIKVTPAAVKALTDHIIGENKLSEQLDGIEKLTEQLERDQVDVKEVKQTLNKAFLKPEQLQDKEKLAENIKDIVKAADKLEMIIKENKLEGKVDTSPLQELKNNLDLMKSINAAVNYLQIPVQIYESRTTAEIYVYQGNKRSRNVNPENANILIALDLNNLGHLESLISVYKKNVDITFKVEKEAFKSVIDSSSQALMKALEASGYKLHPLKIIDLEERFSIIEQEELKNGTSGQFSVDIRV